LYFLDDDNSIHPQLYKLLDIVDDDKIYTFNQENRIKGNNVKLQHVDSAMVIFPLKLCDNERWVLNRYEADGIYIVSVYNKNKNVHVFVDNDLCFYNTIK
jgi:hypothetical protein